MILSRGLLTFAFFGTDTFVPYALHSGRGASVFVGSVAVTLATLSWTIGTWIQDRWIGRTGEACFVRLAYAVLLPAIVVVALGALPDLLPFWVIHVGWAARRARHRARLRRPLAARRCAARRPTSTARRRRRCSCSTTSASPSAPAPSASSSRSATTSAGPPGDAAAVAFGVTAGVAALGLVVSRRLPARAPRATSERTVAAD